MLQRLLQKAFVCVRTMCLCMNTVDSSCQYRCFPASSQQPSLQVQLHRWRSGENSTCCCPHRAVRKVCVWREREWELLICHWYSTLDFCVKHTLVFVDQNCLFLLCNEKLSIWIIYCYAFFSLEWTLSYGWKMEEYNTTLFSAKNKVQS